MEVRTQRKDGRWERRNERWIEKKRNSGKTNNLQLSPHHFYFYRLQAVLIHRVMRHFTGGLGMCPLYAQCPLPLCVCVCVCVGMVTAAVKTGSVYRLIWSWNSAIRGNIKLIRVGGEYCFSS